MSKLTKKARKLTNLIADTIGKKLDKKLDNAIRDEIFEQIVKLNEHDVLEGFKGGIPYGVMYCIRMRFDTSTFTIKPPVSRSLCKELHTFYRWISHDRVILYRACTSGKSEFCVGPELPIYIEGFQIRYRKSVNRYEISTYCKNCLRIANREAATRFRLNKALQK